MAFSGWTNDQIALQLRALEEENVALRNKLMDASEENFNLQASMVTDDAERKYIASLEVVNLQSELNFKNREIEDQKREHAKASKEVQELRKKLAENRENDIKSAQSKSPPLADVTVAADLSHLPSTMSHAVIKINAAMDELLIACSLPINSVQGVMESSFASHSRPQSRTPTSISTLSVQTKAKEIYDSLHPLLPALASCWQRVAAQLLVDQEWSLLPLLRMLNEVCTVVFSSVDLSSSQSYQSLLQLLTLIWQLLPFTIIQSQQKDNDQTRKNLAKRFDELETVPLTMVESIVHPTVTRRQRVMTRITITSVDQSVTAKHKFKAVNVALKVEVNEIAEVIEATLDSLKPLIQFLTTIPPHPSEPMGQHMKHDVNMQDLIVRFLSALVAKCDGNEVLSSLSRYLTVLFDYNQLSQTTSTSPTTMIQTLTKVISSNSSMEREQLWHVIAQLLTHDKLYEKFLFAEIALLRQYKAHRTQKKKGVVEMHLPILLFALQELKLGTMSKLEANILRYHHAIISSWLSLLHHWQDTILMILLQYIPFDDGSGNAVHEHHARHEDEMDVDDNDEVNLDAASSHHSKRRKSRTPQSTAAEQSQSLPKSKRGNLHKGSNNKRKSSSSSSTVATVDDNEADPPPPPPPPNNAPKKRNANALDESTVLDHERFEWRTFAMADLSPAKIRHGKHFLTAFVQYWFELWRLCDFIPTTSEHASYKHLQEQQCHRLLVKLTVDTTRLLNTMIGSLTKDQQHAMLRDALQWIEAFMVHYCSTGLNPALQIAEQDVKHLDAASSNS